MSGQRRSWQALLSALVLAAVAALLPLVGSAQEQLQLGTMTYSRAAAPALRMPVTGSVRFFRSVGGVAFDAVARGDGGLVVTGLRYDVDAPDGQRLLVGVRTADGAAATVRGSVYDWQLVPIARFALDENGSAVTLFGRLEDEGAEARVHAAGGRIINYHPALDDTLVGLRLFQADILIIQPNAADLFRQNGEVIFGAGERDHDPLANFQRFAQLADWQDVESARGHAYQSYVVGDLHQAVTFSIRNGALAFAGEPHWRAWRSRFDSPADRARREQLYDERAARIDAYNALVDEVNAGRLTGARLAAADALLDAWGAEIDAIEEQLDALAAIEEMPEYSEALSLRIRELEGINPVVYDTLRTVMHYRALFKHYQQRDAAGFAAFVESLGRVPVQPAVTTPTIQSAPAPPR